jgi:hypothetical protein
MEPTIYSPVSLQPIFAHPSAGKGRPATKDDDMMEKALIEARASMANGKVGVRALLL